MSTSSLYALKTLSHLYNEPLEGVLRRILLRFPELKTRATRGSCGVGATSLLQLEK